MHICIVSTLCDPPKAPSQPRVQASSVVASEDSPLPAIQVLVSHRLRSTRETAMTAIPANTPCVVYLLLGSKDKALQDIHSSNRLADSRWRQHLSVRHLCCTAMRAV